MNIRQKEKSLTSKVILYSSISGTVSSAVSYMKTLVIGKTITAIAECAHCRQMYEIVLK